MKVFLAGASGFIGERVLSDLMSAGHEVVAHVHGNRSKIAVRQQYPNITVVQADLANAKEVQGMVSEGTAAIIYLPGVLRESKGLTFEGIHVIGVKYLLDEAKRIGTRRWIQMSALGAAKDGNTQYYRTKWEAEEMLRRSGLDLTILRPSLVFDDRPRRQHNFVGEIVKAIRQAPFVPILGSGQFLLQPVSLDDVSQSVVQSLSKPETIGQIYELGGPQKMSYTQVIEAIASSTGTRKARIQIPLSVISLAATLLDWLPAFPVSRDEIRMLSGGNYVHDEAEERKWRETFDLPLKPFVPSLDHLRVIKQNTKF